MVAQNIFFYLFAAVIVYSAIRVVTTRNVVHAALFLVGVLAAVGAQYVLLAAEFVAATQVAPGSFLAAGDVNGDGFDDVIIGASGGNAGGDSGAGESYLCSAKRAGSPRASTLRRSTGSTAFASTASTPMTAPASFRCWRRQWRRFRRHHHRR